MAPKYVDLQVKEVMPAQKTGGSPGRQAFSSGVTGAPGEFVFLTPITSMAMFDEPPPMQKAQVRGYHVMEVVYGENTGGYITAVGMDSYAAIGKGHPFEIALGEGARRRWRSRRPV